MQRHCPGRTGCALSGCSRRLNSSLCSPSPFVVIYSHKWFSVNRTAPVSKTEQTDAELCAVGSTPGLCGAGAGEVNGCPSCDGFYSCSSFPCLCTPNQQSHMYLHTGIQADTAAPPLPALPHPALGYPLGSMGTLGVRTEIRDLVLSDRWPCLQCRVTSCL